MISVLLYVGGCRHITFGIESGSSRMLKLMKKRQTVTDVQTAIALAKEVGLTVRANLMVGFPGETWDTVQETVDLMRDCLPHEYVICAFVPYPGTDSYQHPERYGILDIDTDMSGYFLLRRDRETSYAFRTAGLDGQVISEMGAQMIRQLSPHMAWAGSGRGCS